MVQVFIDFLKENKAYERWLLRYRQTYHREESMEFLKRCNAEGNYAYMLIVAFNWHTSDEEFKFWNSLWCPWLDIIRESRERLESRQW